MRWPALFLLVLACSCRASCGGPEPLAEQDEEPAVLALERTDLSIVGLSIEGAAIDAGRFRGLVEAAFADPPALPRSLGQGRLDVVGVLEPAPVSVEEDPARPEARLTVEARIHARGLGEPVTAGVVAAGAAADHGAAVELIEKALGDLARGVAVLVDLLGADEQRLILALDSAEPDEQMLAARLLASRRSRAAVEPLGGMLEDPRPHVAEAAADALAAIGDPAAVPLLIGSIRRGDLRSEVRAIEAMAAIGGDEAVAYLEMTALGHEVAEVRRISESALKQLRSRPR